VAPSPHQSAKLARAPPVEMTGAGSFTGTLIRLRRLLYQCLQRQTALLRPVSGAPAPCSHLKHGAESSLDTPYFAIAVAKKRTTPAEAAFVPAESFPSFDTDREEDPCRSSPHNRKR
jgi:hypothetical protein